MYRTKSIEEYLADAAAGQPTPGGGSASALAGAVGVAMACMAANFTVGKKKFEQVWPRVNELLLKCQQAREELLRGVDDDVAAYSYISQAYALPKESHEQKAERSGAIQDALKVAMQPPLRAFNACADVLLVLEELAELANPNLISDVGVAAALVAGALEGARLNVEVNLAALKNEKLVNDTRALLEQKAAPARDAALKTLDKVYASIRK